MRDEAEPAQLAEPFAGWFAARGWTPRGFQLALLAKARAGRSTLLIAPTGGGKTLGGFLPSLIALAHEAAAWRAAPRPASGTGPSVRPHRLHTLYISPLKALSVDVARNLQIPVSEMGLGLRVETRTGDTPPTKRARQRARPPDILLTTPEQLALFLAQENGQGFFGDLKAVIVDELHAIAPTKRGDLLALGLAALERFAPGYRRVGLSATAADPEALARWLAPQGAGEAQVDIVRGEPGPAPRIDVLISQERVPWAGHSGRHALGEVYEAIKTARTALVFVNTRSQAEATFQGLWRINDDNLAIALHHGSLAVEQRRKVEAAMAAGRLRAVVCTSTLDLGIDWGDVDLVIQMGAPKGSARLIQRVGRSNHRLEEPSRALLTPSNRFEALECRAAQEAVRAGRLDGDELKPGALDVLAQHVMGRACGEGFRLEELFDELRAAAPYADLTWETFERVVDFVATGGYALRSYERFRRIAKGRDGVWRAREAKAAQRHRLNVGVIVESPMLSVVVSASRGPARRTGRKLGDIEEWFVEQLTPGDTFLFAGQVLRLEAVVETSALVTRAAGEDPKTPMWQGGKFPLSTFLAQGVRAMISDPARWGALPGQVQEWLAMQRARSLIPGPEEMLVETFPHGARHFLVAYPFEGRLAHQTLGMLLTRRLERAGLQPMGFVANDYALSVWGLKDMSKVDLDALFEEDMLGDDLEAWLAESVMMKRTFRTCAVIAGLIERRAPGAEKSGRQVTFSADLLYDVLKAHDPGHLLLEAAWRDARNGQLDLGRLGEGLKRIKGRIRHARLGRVSPLAAPVLLEIGKVPIHGDGQEALLAEAAEELIAAAMRG